MPVHPELVLLLRSHLEQHGTGPYGRRVFTGARGGALTDRAYLAVFHKARGTASAGRKQHRYWPGAPTASVTPPFRHGLTPEWPSRSRPDATGLGQDQPGNVDFAVQHPAAVRIRAVKTCSLRTGGL